MTTRHLICCCALAALPYSVRAADITVSAGLAGKTPEIVGYNSGHFMPGSNTADWWRYSGVNGARVWATPNIVEPNDDGNGWGDGVNSQATFIARRTALRTGNNPLDNSYNNWPYYEGRYQNNPTTGSNIINLKYAFDELKSLNIEPLVVMNRTNSSYPFAAAGTAAGWADRWEHWQHFYAQAFYFAKNYDAHRFQMYNEPNLDQDLPVAEYLERLRLASDAVQSAVQDVNRIYGKNLTPEMNAPVTAGSTGPYAGWGAPVMQNLHTNYLGQNDPSFNLIQTYSYQQYNATGETFGNNLATVKNSVNAAAGGTPIRFAITEFNVHTAAAFDGMTETLDTPSKSARLGSILANLTNTKVEELYVFKFSQGPGDGDSGIKKNGTHFVDNNSAPHNIGGVTKGGEVVRLFAKGFAGANDLFNLPTASGSGATDLRLSASHNAEQNKYYLLSANEGGAPQTLTVNLSNWGIEPGARVIVEQVSADRHGEVSNVLTVPANRTLTLNQPAQSVLLFSVPKFKSKNYVTLTATNDAVVRTGSNANKNYGTDPHLVAKNEWFNPADRSVTFIKFNTGDIARSEIEQAVLNLWGENVGSASQVIAHVYGIASDNWSESTITWNTAPALKPGTVGFMNDISHNFVDGIGSMAKLVGNLTGTTPRELKLDVTDFVRDHPDQEITFMIAREVRFDGENIDDDLTSLQLASKERGTNPGPQLMLSLSPFALPGDYDGSGVVDHLDFDTWAASYGSTNRAADGDRNGIVNILDYFTWRTSFGSSLPGTASGATAVPEPGSFRLMVLCVFSLFLRAPARRIAKAAMPA